MTGPRETVANELLLEHVTSIQSKLDSMQGDLVEVRERLDPPVMRWAPLSRRVDRIDERVERRRDLVES